MNRRLMSLAAGLAALAMLTGAGGALAQSLDLNRPHKVVFQVSDADPAKWNLAFNNARNVLADLGKDKVSIEIVAYGPGLGMLKMDSVVATRVADGLDSGLSIVACENTMRNQKVGRQDMLPRIGYVDAGVVQLMRRQKEGFAYVRP